MGQPSGMSPERHTPTGLPFSGLLARCFSVPGDDLLGDRAVAAPPLPTHAFGPSASPEIVQEHLDVN